MRLDKYLADMGVGTRSEVKKLMKKGYVTVNDAVIKNGAFQVEPNVDMVIFNDIPVFYQEFVYYMMHKPENYVSSTRDDSLTVLDLMMEPYKGLFPCGRLDKDTTGLLLITNDGQLAHKLLSPNHHVEKEYLVHSDHPLTKEDMELFERGMTIDGNEEVKPAKIMETGDCEYHLIIKEGKYHQIKRMYQAVGNEVVKLKRLRMKNLVLDETLAPGEYRALSKEELDALKEFGC